MNGYLDTGLEPTADQFFELPYVYGIVPVDESTPSRETTVARSYEEPWYVDSLNRAIERAAQVATLEVAGYPPYPNYPLPTPTPAPVPMPVPVPGVQPQGSPSGFGFQISPTMALIGLGLAFAFLSGRRGR